MDKSEDELSSRPSRGHDQHPFSTVNPVNVGSLGMHPPGAMPPQLMHSLLGVANNGGAAIHPFVDLPNNYNAGGPNHNIQMGSVDLPVFFNRSTLYSPDSISRGTERIEEQQGAVTMMTTASMIPRKIQRSLRAAEVQKDEAAAAVSSPPYRSLKQPPEGNLGQAKNPLQHYRLQLQLDQLHQHRKPDDRIKSTDEVIPLRKWIDNESSSGDCKPDNVQKQRGMMLRRTTIAYGIIEIIKAARTSSHSSTCFELQQACTIDNILVRVGKGDEESDDDIKGLQLINPPSSLLFIKPFVSSGEGFPTEDGDGLGEYFEVEVAPRPLPDQAINPLESLVKEKSLIHSVGALIHELYTQGNPILLLYDFQKKGGKESWPKPSSDDVGFVLPSSKRIKTHLQQMAQSTLSPFYPGWEINNMEVASNVVAQQKASHLSLLELGFSSSLSSLVDELLDCKCTLDVAAKDLHLMLLDPCSFLVDRYFKPAPKGKVSLRIRKNKLYGRDCESSVITRTFCRVKTSGKSEALLIGGYSGSGKTRLVQTVLKYYPHGVSSYVVTQNYDESSSSVVIQALDRLCVVIKENSFEDELHGIISRLSEAFETDFSILEEILPNAKLLYDVKRAKPPAPKHQGKDSNSVSFILRLFMRAVSSKEKPVVLFLDELQWCDTSSLDIIHDILSDKKSSSCVFFIGCFRDEEVESAHPIFKLMNSLNTNNIPIQFLKLGGVNRNEVNCMISDALCILPRHCKDLSDIIHSKTKGDPYFALEMLRTLVDQGLLQFSFPKRRWLWNLANIMYLDVTSNVLYLLKSKMMTMSKEVQNALKVCSCLGSGVDSLLVECLSESVEYNSLRDELDKAVEEGFLDKVGEGGYKFVHDRVKEAAYNLIKKGKVRNEFHYHVGMALLSSSKVSDPLVPIMIDQINHGIGESIISAADRIAIAELNYKAGTQAMTQSGFAKAVSYFETAKLLLPEDHWKSLYYFSIRLFLSLSNAAFACGQSHLADEALDAILREAQCLEDKLDAYYFMNNLLFHRGHAKMAFTKCAEVLSEIGEIIPTEVDSKELVDMVEKISHFLTNISDDGLLHFKEVDSKFHFYLMQFYQQLGWFAMFGQSPSLQVFLWCRSVEIAIQCGFCKFTSPCIASFAAVVCGKFKDVATGYRLGRVALSLIKRFDATSLIPVVYLSFYGTIAYNTEPVMDCAHQLHKGFQIGMSVGDVPIALMNGLHYIQKAFVGGKNLVSLSNDVDYQLELCKMHGDLRAEKFRVLFKETLCQIIDKNKARVETTTMGVGAELPDEAMKIEGFSDVVFFHRVIQSFWLGYSDRCHYFAQKSKQGEAVFGKLLGLIASFYHGLAALQILRKKKSKSEMKMIARTSLKLLHAANIFAPMNFKNKVELLEAELHRTGLAQRENEEEKVIAKKMYAKSISSAEAANFVHEKALALESAGQFYNEIGETSDALRLFADAKRHYEKWGSTVRVRQMEEAIAKAELKLSGKNRT